MFCELLCVCLSFSFLSQGVVSLFSTKKIDNFRLFYTDYGTYSIANQYCKRTTKFEIYIISYSGLDHIHSTVSHFLQKFENVKKSCSTSFLQQSVKGNVSSCSPNTSTEKKNQTYQIFSRSIKYYTFIL